jgi:heme A synthase
VSRAVRYGAGLAVIGLAVMLAGARSGPDGRQGMALGAVVGLAIQGPLGWWVVRSVGTDRFLGAWAAGFLARILLLAVMGLVVVPALGWDPAPVLVTLAGVLGGLLLLEGAAAMAGTPQQPQTGSIR